MKFPKLVNFRRLTAWQLKICGSHLRCKAKNKCLNVCEWMEVVDGRNKDDFFPFPAALSIVSAREKNPFGKRS